MEYNEYRAYVVWDGIDEALQEDTGKDEEGEFGAELHIDFYPKISGNVI